MTDRRVPVQWGTNKPAGTITWEEHYKAWEGYQKKYGNIQSAEVIAQRGGFGYYELSDLLGYLPKTWEPR